MTTAASKVSGRGLKVVRDGRAILDVDEIDVRPSEILAVVGPNGAGKSTLIQVLSLLQRPEEGEVTIGSELVTPHREFQLRRQLACVFQSPLLLNRTVYSNVELGLKLRRVPREDRRLAVEKWLQTLGIESLAKRRAGTLSGGEAQRVNIARALAIEPQVLFMDEPLGGLDTPTRHALTQDIGPLVRRGAGAGLLVTHDRRTALALGDRVAVMLDGQIRQLGPPGEVFSHPVDLDVAKFVGVENILPAKSKGRHVAIWDKLELLSSRDFDGEGHLCLRAEEVHFGDAPSLGSRWNSLAGNVASISPRGDGFSVEVDVGARISGRLTRARQAILNLRDGDTVTLSIRPEAVHVIAK